MRTVHLGSLMLMCGACVGNIAGPKSSSSEFMPGESGSGSSSPDVPGSIGESASFLCEASQEPSVTPLRRLSVLQYRNTLQNLFRPAVGFDALKVAQSGLSKLPVDQSLVSFSNQDMRFSEVHLQAWYETADTLAGAVVATPSVLSALAGKCSEQIAPTADCLKSFLDGFAMRVYRRPLNTAERSRYLALNDGTRDGKELFRSIIFSLLMAPEFLYLPEVNGKAENASETLLALDPFEVASRLSFHFWQSSPDEALLAAAADGSLVTEEGYRSELARVVGDPRTQQTMSQFYSEWFLLNRYTQFPSTAAFAAFAQGTTIGQPGADHLAAANAEIETLANHITWKTGGPVGELFTTDLSLTQSPHLAALYGVQPWDGVSDPPRLPAGQRSGLLTRVATLLTGNHQTHPIHRGSFLRRQILCDEMTVPASLPPDALAPPVFRPDESTRQRFENKVSNEPCHSCHAMMNPIGYVLEQFDALGRFRTEEKIRDDVTGEVVNTVPIDTSAQPRIFRSNEQVVSSSVELSRMVAESGRVEACFARQYFRFANRRSETQADNCALERVRKSAGSEGSLKKAIEEIALDPSFRARKVE